jgi:hypothetical protein
MVLGWIDAGLGGMRRILDNTAQQLMRKFENAAHRLASGAMNCLLNLIHRKLQPLAGMCSMS